MLPSLTVPLREIAPAANSMFSSKVVLPLENGPISAKLRGPDGYLVVMLSPPDVRPRPPGAAHCSPPRAALASAGRARQSRAAASAARTRATSRSCVGVATPASRPVRATPPLMASISLGRPAFRSCHIDGRPPGIFAPKSRT